MRVRVRLFARARDLAGAEVLTVELSENADVRQLRSALAAQCPTLTNLLEHSVLAVNEEFAADSTRLSAESDVALLPPVSGGSP